jgi:chromosome segregation ATPase
MLKTL